jgi:hypothetical protein
MAMRSVVTPRRGTQSRTHTMWLSAIVGVAHGGARSVVEQEDQGVGRLQDAAEVVRTVSAQ